MSDRPTSGPAPRWGEYGPVPDPVPEPVIDTPKATPGSADPPRRSGPPAADGSADARPARIWDRALTFGLLTLAVINVLTSIPAYLDLPATLDTVYKTAGYGNYTSDSLASGIGIGINIVNVFLLILAVALSSVSLRARRLTFWIPLLTGVVATIATGVLIGTAMLSDPAFLAYVDQMGAATP